MPVAVYPGLSLAGTRVIDVVTNAKAQFETQAAFHRRFNTIAVFSAMDLSLEAEAFGAEIKMPEDEVPAVVNRLVSTSEDVEKLRVPKPGDKRTGIFLETVRMLSGLHPQPIVLGGMIGPFSLAGRIFGVGESLELVANDPDLMEALLEKCAAFLIDYAKAFKAAGADALLVAEPTAGLLSPGMLGIHSAPYVKRIREAVADERFDIILHDCAARLIHLPRIMESGVKFMHFGSPMDIPAVLKQVPPDVIVSGNLDPSAMFCKADRDEMAARTRELLDATENYRNFVISSGCDLPPNTLMENVEAFFAEVDKGRPANSISRRW